MLSWVPLWQGLSMEYSFCPPDLYNTPQIPLENLTSTVRGLPPRPLYIPYGTEEVEHDLGCITIRPT